MLFYKEESALSNENKSPEEQVKEEVENFKKEEKNNEDTEKTVNKTKKKKTKISTHKTAEKDLPIVKEANINNKGTENPAFSDHRFGQVPPIKRRSKR